MKRYISLLEDFNKKLHLGKIKGANIDLEINVKKKQDAIDWETLQPVQDRDVVSISGTVGRGRRMQSAGQINDYLMDLYKKGDLVLNIDEDKFLKLMGIWDQYHLNDLIPGTKEQMTIIKKLRSKGFDVSANNYNNLIQVLPKSGDYKYGTKWLSREVPEKVINFLQSL